MKKRFGDRRDAYRVRDVHGMQYIMNDFFKTRNEAIVYMNAKIDVTNFVKYIDNLKKEHPDVTYFHGMVDILAHAVYSRPYLNRFVANRKIWEHKDVSFGATIKAEFEDKSEECIMVMKVLPEWTLLDLSKSIKEKVNKIRNNQSADIDGVVEFVGHLPNPLRIPIVGFLKFLDRHGWLPKSLMDDNLYYATAIVSDIGVFKTGAIYHHLVDFGTNSMVVTFGEIKKESDGRSYMEFGATIDERIADGFYFCKALKLIEYMFDNPDVMMKPASEHIHMPLPVEKKKNREISKED